VAGDDWIEYRRHVLSELKRMNEWMDKIDASVADLKTETKLLHMKAGMFGALAGGIAAGIAIVAKFLM